MLKNVNKLFLFLFLLPIYLYSNPNDEFMQMQKFYYEQGYKEGAKKFYKKGVEDYQDYVLNTVLPQYEAKFMAIEATKYLIKESYITFPETYRQTSENGSYKVVLTEPKIERPIKAEELFRMPESKIKNAESEISNTNNNSDEKVEKSKKPFQNGLKVVDDTETKEEIPTSVSSIKQQTSLDISKTKENLSMIQKLDLKYLDSFSGYKVYFENNTQKANFCYQLNGDSTCSNLN